MYIALRNFFQAVKKKQDGAQLTVEFMSRLQLEFVSVLSLTEQRRRLKVVHFATFWLGSYHLERFMTRVFECSYCVFMLSLHIECTD